jgi:N-acetylmuramoyl-L-alanine amidase
MTWTRVTALAVLVIIMTACGSTANQIQPFANETATRPASPQSTLVPDPPTETATTEPLQAPPTATAHQTHVHPTATSTAEVVAVPATPAVPSEVTPADQASAVETATAEPQEDNERPLVIVLDPGHDPSTPGALGIEYQFVLRTAFIARTALEEAGYEVHLTREDNDYVFSEHPELLPPNAADMHPGYGAAYAHATKALQFNPDLVLLLHYNGHPSPDVRGIEIYYCEMGGPQNLVLAEIVTEELVVALQTIGYETPPTRIAEDLSVARGNRHFPSLGNVYDPPQHWVENRYAGIPVVLTEPLYMTNPIERPFLDDEATHQAIADAYVRAIDRYFGR